MQRVLLWSLKRDFANKALNPKMIPKTGNAGWIDTKRMPIVLATINKEAKIIMIKFNI